LRLDVTTFGPAFALTLVAAVFAYLANSPLSVPELVFLLLVFYAVTRAAKWLWIRARARRT
jgi:hypothetical protein